MLRCAADTLKRFQFLELCDEFGMYMPSLKNILSYCVTEVQLAHKLRAICTDGALIGSPPFLIEMFLRFVLTVRVLLGILSYW
jgi:hypothetical protein